MKKSILTRELVNAYPSWSRTRSDEQSIGFQFLNALAVRLEKMERTLIKQRANYYLPTVNLDEIDITYALPLAADFEFSQDYTNPLIPAPTAPAVSGLVTGVWYPVSLADENTVENFWYESTPNRLSLSTTTSGTSETIVSTLASGLPVTGLWEHHLDDGGALWIECSGGVEYITMSNGKALRAKVIIEGTTRKGTKESETLIFPWDMRQRTRKEWKEIEYVGAFDMEDTVTITVTSSDFNSDHYLSSWNLRYSENRRKVDEFWALGDPVTSGVSVTLDRVGYISDEWQQLVQGYSDTEVKERWELLGDSLEIVSGVDVALQPFSDNVWLVTSDYKLICYDVSEMMPSGIDMLQGKTAGPDVQIDLEQKSVVMGEDILILPWHARPVKEILRYRIWYQTPSGTKYGLLAGSPVSYSSDFWVYGSQTITRTIENLISLTPAERGEYLFVLEAQFLDEETQVEKIIIPVNYKTPRVTLDLSAILSEPPLGIEFDSDQKIWIKTASAYHRINLHTDVMIIDYDEKVIYFKEEYESVGVDSD